MPVLKTRDVPLIVGIRRDTPCILFAKMHTGDESSPPRP